MRTYGQYCPIARAAEILAERWTPLVLRNLLLGSTTFNQIADGAPGIPRSLLTSRLRELERAGVVERRSNERGRGSRYGLTTAGGDLGGVMLAMGSWGERWLELAPEHLDPGVVLNSWVSWYLASENLPDRRVVVRFDFPDRPRKANQLWIIFDGDRSEVCRTNPRLPGGPGGDVGVPGVVRVAPWPRVVGRCSASRAHPGGRATSPGARAAHLESPKWLGPAGYQTREAASELTRSSTASQRRSFEAPDEVRRFPHGTAEILHLGSLTIGRGILEPGWRWSTSLKPIQGTTSCQVHHIEILLEGRFRVQWDDGETADFGPGDVFDVPPGHDAWVIGDEPVVIVDVSGNIGAVAVPGEHERLVTTLLMSDIVDSTATAARIGDARWKQLLADHNRIIRTQLDRFRGREVNTTGDGFLATFGSAAGALRAAMAMRDGVSGLGIEIRIGVHTGEVDVLPNDIGGVAVHAASRIMTLADASEIIVSSVTRGLVEGSGLRFEERGRHQVKGLEQPIEVFLLAH